MLKRGQVSFFAIIGIFMVIITAGIIATTSRISQSHLDTELAKQAALNDDRLLLEWYSDEAITSAALSAINNSKVTANEIEAGIAKMLDPTQFTRRGAAASVGYPSVKLIATGKYLIVDAELPVRLQRPWGEVGIKSRSIRVSYNGTLE